MFRNHYGFSIVYILQNGDGKSLPLYTMLPNTTKINVVMLPNVGKYSKSIAAKNGCLAQKPL